jgi:glucose-1-phosphate cytidylyltransferase
MTDQPIDTVILCGGRGTRLREFTETLPKVLVEIGDKPIVWHIMKNFTTGGYGRFILALGYLGETVKSYFEDPSNAREPWQIQFAMTGEDTNTGGRIKKVEGLVTGQTFFATYGDGLSDIDLSKLLHFHQSHGRIATVTAVRPRFNFGLMQLDGQDRVTSFAEKPILDHWINGGFFVFDRRIFDYLDAGSVLETTPLETLATDGELVAYKHEGFWACMDTYKDHAELNQLWTSHAAPWLRWSTAK